MGSFCNDRNKYSLELVLIKQQNNEKTVECLIIIIIIIRYNKINRLFLIQLIKPITTYVIALKS